MNETLYTLPLDGQTVKIPSIPKKVTNKSYSQLFVGEITRDENFEIRIPEDRYDFVLPAKFFQKLKLSTQPDGNGEIVTCWQRVK